MNSFNLECDGSDGLLLIDKANLNLLSPQHLAAFDILLDRDGKTELRRDFPNEAWDDAWNRESELMFDFLNSGKGFLALVGGGNHKCSVHLDDASVFDSTTCIHAPSGSLIAVSASEIIQCLAYPDLTMNIPYEKLIHSGWYAIQRQSGLTFRLAESAAPKGSCKNVFM
jgi:hypothetical protein